MIAQTLSATFTQTDTHHWPTPLFVPVKRVAITLVDLVDPNNW